MDLIFKFKLFLLKRKFKKLCKYEKLYENKSAEKRKYISFFIRDKEDENLNKSTLEEFDKKIKKCKVKKYKLEIEIDKLLFSLNICDSNFLFVLYQKRIDLEDVSLIKEILMRKIENRKI